MNQPVHFAEQLRQRTKTFALRVIYLFQKLPKTDEARIIGKQLLRSATSMGANYRAACRARSDAEHFAKMSIVLEEADEAAYWMELLVEAELVTPEKLGSLQKEANELIAIFATTRKTLQDKKQAKI